MFGAAIKMILQSSAQEQAKEDALKYQKQLEQGLKDLAEGKEIWGSWKFSETCSYSSSAHRQQWNGQDSVLVLYGHDYDDFFPLPFDEFLKSAQDGTFTYRKTVES